MQHEALHMFPSGSYGTKGTCATDSVADEVYTPCGAYSMRPAQDAKTVVDSIMSMLDVHGATVGPLLQEESTTGDSWSEVKSLNVTRHVLDVIIVASSVSIEGSGRDRS